MLFFGYFSHCPRILSTLLDWVESPIVGRSLFAICIAHCSQFEHSGDFTLQFFQTMCKRTSCAVMVITGRAHCYPLESHIW